MLERLADLPGTARLLGLALQIAPRHVEADRIAEDVVQRLSTGMSVPPRFRATTSSISRCTSLLFGG